jgi:hypothetical protein
MPGAGIGRGREPAGSGGNPKGGNPLPRRAVCDHHSYGSVRGAPGNRGPYSSTFPPAIRSARRTRVHPRSTLVPSGAFR